MTADRQLHSRGMDLDTVSLDDLATWEAIESGMARRELIAILDGRRITDLIPVVPGEAPHDYAVRATGELMVRYLGQDTDHPMTSPRGPRGSTEP